MKTADNTPFLERVCLVAKMVVVGDGTIFEPGYVVFSKKTGLIESVAGELPNDMEYELRSAELVTPGFVDIHLHGVGGSEDLIEFWSHPEYTLSRLPAFGTTSCLASIVVPGDEEGYAKSMIACDALTAVTNKEGLGAVVRGIHSEGPIIASLGGLPEPAHRRNMVGKEFDAMLDQMGPHLKVMTISPSMESSSSVNKGEAAPCSRLHALLKRGVVPSLGHDKVCTEDDILECLRAGKFNNPHNIRYHLTHAFNV